MAHMSKNTHLLTIDPQFDFCNPKGTLFVPGADKDSERLAKFINDRGDRFADIHTTVDSHQIIHIAHPIFWKDPKGNHPKPFTQITADDVANGRWNTTNPAWQSRGLAYVRQLELDTPDHPARYKLFIWPPHCLIGTVGHALVPAVSDALIAWETRNFGQVNFVAKGSNLFTEHYSAVQADVPDDKDPSTRLNTDLITLLSQVDEILITGQALSHCVANTIRDIAANFGDDNVKKFTLIRDTTSSVPTLEFLGDAFIADMTAKGMKVTTTNDWN